MRSTTFTFHVSCGQTSTHPSRPFVMTTPSARAARKRAGSVRRLLSSIACSYSPKNIGSSLVSATVPHFKPLSPTLQPTGHDAPVG